MIHSGKGRRGILCPNTAARKFGLPEYVSTPDLLFGLMQTRPLERGLARRKFLNWFTLAPPDPVQVGTINRPRICAIPALIIFMFFYVISYKARKVREKRELARDRPSGTSRHGLINEETASFSDRQEIYMEMGRVETALSTISIQKCRKRLESRFSRQLNAAIKLEYHEFGPFDIISATGTGRRGGE